MVYIKMEQEIQQLKMEMAELKSKLDFFIKQDRYLFQRDVEMFNGRNIKVGKGTGTKIGTSASEKLAFFGKTPIVQPTVYTAPVGGTTIDAECRAATNELATIIDNLGLKA